MTLQIELSQRLFFNACVNALITHH